MNSSDLQADLELVATELHGWHFLPQAMPPRWTNREDQEFVELKWLLTGDGMLATIEKMSQRYAVKISRGIYDGWFTAEFMDVRRDANWHRSSVFDFLSEAVIRAAAAAIRAQAQDAKPSSPSPTGEPR